MVQTTRKRMSALIGSTALNLATLRANPLGGSVHKPSKINAPAPRATTTSTMYPTRVLSIDPPWQKVGVCLGRGAAAAADAAAADDAADDDDAGARSNEAGARDEVARVW